jgi:hypothetical protein
VQRYIRISVSRSSAENVLDASDRYLTLLQQQTRVDKLLKELTPLEGGIADPEALEGWVRTVNGKVEMTTEELRRLQGRITRTSLVLLIVVS